MIDFRVVQERQEGTIIPQGISVTETEISFWVRIRVNDSIVTIKISKEPEQITWALGYDGNTKEEQEIYTDPNEVKRT